MRETFASVLCVSPSGSTTSMQRRGASAAVSFAAYNGPTVVLVTSRTSRAGMARSSSALSCMAPAPMKIG